LNEAGHAVDVAQDGSEGLEYAIAVQSHLAAGTTFTVTLPRTLGEESQATLLSPG